MTRQVYLENWQEQLEFTIETVAKATACESASPEQAALLAVSPQDREVVHSAVLPWTVKEPLQLPDNLVSRLEELFDVYRRFRTRLEWSIDTGAFPYLRGYAAWARRWVPAAR